MQKNGNFLSNNLLLTWLIVFIFCISIFVIPVKTGTAEGFIGNTNIKDGEKSTGVEIANLNPKPPEDMVSSYANNKIELRYKFQKPEIHNMGDKNYITLSGLKEFERPGEPVLPVKTTKILLPPGKVMQGIEIITNDPIKCDGEYVVQHGSDPRPISDPNPLIIPENLIEVTTEPNKSIYESKKPFPGRLHEYVKTETCRGFNILILNLFPIQYTPDPGQIYYYDSMEVTVTVQVQNHGSALGASTSNPITFRGLAKDLQHISSIVDNPTLTSTYSSLISSSKSKSIQPVSSSIVNPSESYDYVIITNESLNDSSVTYNFQALVNSKINKGLNATIVTLENITTEPAYWNQTSSLFNDTQAQIRNFIIDAYLHWGIEYVLLGGDADGSDKGATTETNGPVIPARGLKGWYEDNIPSDLYFGALDGNWNTDEDSSWGEYPQEADMYAEVYVGRAPIDSETELSNFVRKTLEYENTTPNDPVLKKIWFLGEYLWGPSSAPVTLGADYMDEIIFGSSAHGYTTVGIPGNFTVKTLYDRDYPGHSWPKNEIISIINDNAHVINHLGHSNVGYNMRLGNSDADALTNSKYFMAYSQGCYCGSFDNRGTGSGYYTYDSIAEHFVTEPSGAFAFIANSRYGYGSTGSTDGASQYFNREFYDAIYSEKIYNIGKANQDAKEDNIGVLSEHPVMVYCCYEINLLGDPEIALKVPVPPENDIEVKNLSAPQWVEFTKNPSINATISNNGLNTEYNIKVNFTIDGVTNASKTITSLPSLYKQNVSFVWTPLNKGIYEIAINASIVAGESLIDNNVQAQSIEVIPMPDIWINNNSYNVISPQNQVVNRTLVIGNNGLENLTYKIIKMNVAIEYGGRVVPQLDEFENLIESFGYNVDIVSGADIDTIQELNEYDVVILGSSGYGPDDDFATFEVVLEDWVYNYSGAVVGVSGIDFAVDENSPIGQLMPVDTGPAQSDWGSDCDYHNGGTLAITAQHEITVNVSDITVPSGTGWFSSRHGLNSGATKLAKSPTFNPAIACWDYGKGRTVFLAAGFMLDQHWYSTDWWFTNARISDLLNNSLKWSTRFKESGWLTTDLTNGSIEINQNSSIEIIINTTNLTIEDYYGVLTIKSNDLDPNNVRVYVNLTVLGNLKTIQISPAIWSGTADEYCTFTAVGYDIRHNQVKFEKKWSTTDPDGTVVDSEYNPAKVGTWRVYCNHSNNCVSSYVKVTIAHGALHHIEQSETSWVGSVDDKSIFQANGYDADNNKVPFTQYWSTNDPKGSVINSEYFPGTPGTWRVYCNNSDNSVSSYITVIVKEGKLIRIELSPTFYVCSADDFISIDAIGYDKMNNPVEFTKHWSTTDPWGTVAELYSGIYYAGKVGTWRVYCNNSDNSISNYLLVIVNHGALNRIVITPQNSSITADDTLQFQAKGFDLDGNQISINPYWIVTGGGTIDQNGLFDAINIGSWEVIANVGEIDAKTKVTITPGIPKNIEISPNEFYMTADEQVKFDATVLDGDGNIIPPMHISSYKLNWKCTDGTIDSSGMFTPDKTGTINIYATLQKPNLTDTAVVNISPGKLNRIIITPETATITVDEILQYSAVVYDKNLNTIGISSNGLVRWSVENGEISSSGMYYPDEVGTWRVSAIIDDVSCSVEVTVTHGTLMRTNILPVAATLEIGEYENFVMTGYDRKNNNWSIPNTEILWVVSEKNIGAIDSNGKFISLTHGTTIVTGSVGDFNSNAIVIVIPIDTDNDDIPDYFDTDDDNDELPDAWENEYNFNPLDHADANIDPDFDGLTNLDEYNINTDPRNADTDADDYDDSRDAYPLDRTKWLEKDDEIIKADTKEDADSTGVIAALLIIIVIMSILFLLLLYRRSRRGENNSNLEHDENNTNLERDENNSNSEIKQSEIEMETPIKESTIK